MNDDRVRNFVTQISDEWRRQDRGEEGLQAAVDHLRSYLNAVSEGLADQHELEIQRALELIREADEEIEILTPNSIRLRRPDWYFGPRVIDFHWPNLLSYLSNVKKWPDADITSIDHSSTEVVSLLENPRDNSNTNFRCKGLVVGHVQSGKTANMTAVIAKAVDAGYNVIIVLAGLTNKLRKQTQDRLFNDLIGENNSRWHILSPLQEDADLRAPAHGGFIDHDGARAQLAVIKKNVSPLRQLQRTIEDTPPPTLRRLRVLLIDDECDQASVNSANGERDMTVINRRIREILASLPAVSYVGYTGTPFANVLINPYSHGQDRLDDLYPESFITALPTPPSYFGAERLFGIPALDPENPTADEDGLNVIRDVSEEDASLLQPARAADRYDFVPQIPESLQHAILYFLMSCAERHLRGQDSKHMSMLVHTSAYVALHNSTASAIQTWIGHHLADATHVSPAIRETMREIWERESNALGPNDSRQHAFDRVFSELPTVMQRLTIPVENGSSDDRIDYEEPPKTYIVVGGSILARGLTLEGLTVSYFLRSSLQYDTLLQMGRWFGYRPGYEDLPRIWTTEDLASRFRSLARIELEVRNEIAQYLDRDLTPSDFAVRIRQIPGMHITARNKMRAARNCAVSFWGAHKQTIRFSSNNELLLRENWEAAAKLITDADIGGQADHYEGRRLWRGVPVASIRSFLELYELDDSVDSDLNRGMLIPFITSDDERLARWNVGIIENQNGETSEQELGAAGSVRLIRRSKLQGTSNVADIKGLMSKQDITYDCAPGDPDANWEDLKNHRRHDIGQVPLLLIYPINRNSPPGPRSRSRENLNAVFDVIGVGLVFPGVIEESGTFVQVTLTGLSVEEINEIDELEGEQSEAAGD